MSAVRDDLLHLSPEALAQVANLGLVKRAARELEAGNRPTLEVDEAGTLKAFFSDGVEIVWEAGKSIQDSRCTCGAGGVCRHRIMAALAYRSASEQAPSQLASPAQVEDDTLTRLIPARTLALAHAQRAAGISIEVRHTTAGEPCPTARLPAATVRFWAGAAIEAARCDCVAGSACEHVALAVWAFREAHGKPEAPSVQVQLGEPARAVVLDQSPYLALAESLLSGGVRRGATTHAQALTHALEAASNAGAVWLQLLLGELEAWLGAYAARSARYQPDNGYRLIAELALRLAAGSRPGRAKAALGVGEAQESELDGLRLVSLGCRVERDGEDCHAQVVLADMDTASRFVLNHRWRESGSAEPDLSRQRLAPGIRLRELAAGQLLSRNARRRADGTLTLAKARSAQNSLLPQDGDWSALGPPLGFSRVADLRAMKQAEPIRQTALRHVAGSFVVFRAGMLDELFYDPGNQTVVALLRDADDETLIVRRGHSPHARHGLDAVAGALDGKFGPLRYVAGALGWHNGRPVIEPWALACDRVVVPDTEPACGALAGLLLGTVEETSNSGPVRELETLLADLLHHGVKDLGADWRDRAQALTARLRSQSLFVLGRALETLTHEATRAAANPEDCRLAPHLMHLAALTALHDEAKAMSALG